MYEMYRGLTMHQNGRGRHGEQKSLDATETRTLFLQWSSPVRGQSLYRLRYPEIQEALSYVREVNYTKRNVKERTKHSDINRSCNRVPTMKRPDCIVQAVYNETP
jgi:hypothetical protein